MEEENLNEIKEIIFKHFKIEPNKAYYYAGKGDFFIDERAINSVVRELDFHTQNEKIANLFLKTVILSSEFLSPADFSTRFGEFLKLLGGCKKDKSRPDNLIVKCFEILEDSQKTNKNRKYGTGYSKGFFRMGNFNNRENKGICAKNIWI